MSIAEGVCVHANVHVLISTCICIHVHVVLCILDGYFSGPLKAKCVMTCLHLVTRVSDLLLKYYKRKYTS